MRRNRVIRRKHGKPDMHVQCSSVAASAPSHATARGGRTHKGANQCPSQLYQRDERTYRCLSQRGPSSQRRLVELRALGGITGSRSATTGTYAITVATASRTTL